MIAHSGHLKDDQIFECYLADRLGEPLDPRTADHLSDCEECTARYEDLTDVLTDLRADADADVDELFPADRLAAQQQQILRRVAQVNRSARVITFPGRDLASGVRSATRVTPRWLAAAAAAGLFVGVAVGGYLGPNHLSGRPVRQTAQLTPAMKVQSASANAPAVRVNSAQAEPSDDETFLVELDVALAHPHARELQPFDAMTPHVRDIDVRTR